MAISNTEITNTGNNIFVCPGTISTDVQEHAVTCIIFCNTSTESVELTLHLVPYGSVPTNVTTIIDKLSIPASETFSFDTEKVVLSTGDTVHAIASDDSRLVSTVSSMRVS